jgi:hypothetical protein
LGRLNITLLFSWRDTLGFNEVPNIDKSLDEVLVFEAWGSVEWLRLSSQI